MPTIFHTLTIAVPIRKRLRSTNQTSRLSLEKFLLVRILRTFNILAHGFPFSLNPIAFYITSTWDSAIRGKDCFKSTLFLSGHSSSYFILTYLLLIWRSIFDFVFWARILQLYWDYFNLFACMFMQMCVLFRIYNVMSYACRNSFNSFFPVWMPFVSLSGLISLRRSSGMMLNKMVTYFSCSLGGN